MKRLHVLDRDPTLSTRLGTIYGKRGCQASHHSTMIDLLYHVKQSVDLYPKETVVIIDLAGLRTDEDPTDTCFQISALAPTIVTGQSISVSMTTALIRAGAYQVFSAPLVFEVLSETLQKALESPQSVVSRLTKVVPSLTAENAVESTVQALKGDSKRITELRHEILRYGGVRGGTVLLKGATGTGKNLVAGLIHDASPRSKHKIVEVNCGALQETLLESELFGHKKGSFTGAISDKPGLLEEAHKGTVFLDEIDSMSPALQVKLLTFLESRMVRRLGDTRVKEVDCRVICATNADLEEAIKEGKFREDLYWRINVISIELPSLNDITEDIELIAYSLLESSFEEIGKRSLGFTAEAIAALQAHSWPGNVRQLRNRVQRGLIRSNGDFITATDLQLTAPKTWKAPVQSTKVIDNNENDNESLSSYFIAA